MKLILVGDFVSCYLPEFIYSNEVFCLCVYVCGIFKVFYI